MIGSGNLPGTGWTSWLKSISTALPWPVSIKQLAWPSAQGLGFFAGDLPQDVVHHGIGLEMCHRSRLGAGNPGIVTDQEDPFGDARLEGLPVGAPESQAAAQSGVFDQFGALVGRDDNQQVVAQFLAVRAADTVFGHARQVGIVHHLDVLLHQDMGEHPVAHRLGEGAV